MQRRLRFCSHQGRSRYDKEPHHWAGFQDYRVEGLRCEERGREGFQLLQTYRERLTQMKAGEFLLVPPSENPYKRMASLFRIEITKKGWYFDNSVGKLTFYIMRVLRGTDTYTWEIKHDSDKI